MTFTIKRAAGYDGKVRERIEYTYQGQQAARRNDQYLERRHAMRSGLIWQGLIPLEKQVSEVSPRLNRFPSFIGYHNHT
jgi:hypothetical protein